MGALKLPAIYGLKTLLRYGERKMSENWKLYAEIKKQTKQYVCELVAATVLVVLMFLLKGVILGKFPNCESVFDGLLIGFIGSMLSLLVVMIVYLFHEFFSTKLVVNSILNSCKNNNMDKKIKSMIQATCTVQPHWGRVPEDKHTHPSNIAEGILAYVSAYEIGLISPDDPEYKEIQSLAKMCIEIITKIEQPNTSFKYTTQALSMQLFAIAKCKSRGIISLSPKEASKIEEVVRRLLLSAQNDSRGWGYFAFDDYSASDDSAILMVPTLWALRAINAWGSGSYDKFEKILEKISKESIGIGFKYNSEPHFSSTALLCLLVSELRDCKFKEKYSVIWNSVAKRLISDSCPEYEVEISYFKDQNDHLKVNYWIHLSRCLLIEAAAMNRSSLTIRQALTIKKMIDQSASQIDKFYRVRGLTENEAMIPLYPSFYLISALTKLYKTGLKQKN